MEFVLKDLAKGPKNLVNLLAKERDVELSVTLAATAPEGFHDLAERCMKLEKLSAAEAGTELAGISPGLIERSRRLRILPFTTMTCDFNSYLGPKVVHHYPYEFERPPEVDLLFFLCTNPVSMLSWRPRMIFLDEARKEQSLTIVRDTVRLLTPHKYFISGLRAGFKPRDWGHEYCGGTDYDAHISLDFQGKVIISGVKGLPARYIRQFREVPKVTGQITLGGTTLEL